MKSLFFVTSNENKIKEAKKILEPEFQVISSAMKIPEIQSMVQEEIALEKVRYAFQKIKEPLIIDDTGLFIEKYNNFPGVLTKFILEGIGLNGVAKLIEEKEPAYFRTIIIYKDTDKEFVVEGIIKGYLTKQIPNYINPLAPFNSIFFVPEAKKFIRDFDKELLKRFSHRGLALKKLKNLLESNFNN
jgi:XTP/dITP diphosphohydrolase